MNGPAAAPAPRGRARLGLALAIIASLALATGVVAWVGARAVLGALALIGWRGLAVLVAYAAFPASLLGTSWFVLVPPSPRRRWRTFLIARILRDAGGDLLPFTQLGGYVIGARAAVLRGLAPAMASASTVVDVTVELIAQIGFTAVGAAMLAIEFGGRPMHGTLLSAALGGGALSAVVIGAFVIVQRRASGPIQKLAARFFPALVTGAADFGRAMDEVYRRRIGVFASTGLHLAAWIASAGGVWLALRFAGEPISLPAVLEIESLVAAVRSAGFVAPMAIGVQEAAYGVIGPIFGLPADIAVALSLVKRANSLVIGAPALMIWQAVEGRRLVALRRAGL